MFYPIASFFFFAIVIYFTEFEPSFIMRNYKKRRIYFKRLVILLRKGDYFEIVSFLENNDVDQDAIMTALGYAFVKENYLLIEYILKNDWIDLEYSIFDLSVNCVDVIPKVLQDKVDRGSENPTPLMFACIIGNLKIVKMLIEAGASIHRKNDTDYSPLTSAIIGSNMEIVTYLVKLGVDIEGKTGAHSQSISLITAVCSGSLDMLRFFVNRVSNINITDDTGSTALMFTVLHNNIAMASILLNHKVDVHIRNEEGDDVLDEALEMGSGEMITIIKEYR